MLRPNRTSRLDRRRTPDVEALMRPLRGLLPAVLVLSIGAGGLATAYAIFDALVLDPFPYRAPDDLVRIWDDEGLPGYRNLAASEFGSVGRHAQLLSDIAPFLSVTQRIQSTRDADHMRLRGVVTTPGLFRLLGVTNADGSELLPHREAAGQVVLSERLRRLGVVRKRGDDVFIDGERYTVAAITPPGFWFPDAQTDYWLPLLSETPSQDEGWHAPIIGRLAPGADTAAAAGEVQALLNAEDSSPSKAAVRLVSDEARELAAPALGSMQIVAGLLVLLTSANAAWLLAARASRRRRTFAVMAALGASPRHVVRSQVTEAAILTVLSTPIAVGIAWLGIHYIVVRGAAHVPSLLGASVTSGVVVTGALGASVLACLAMVPASWIAFSAARDRQLLHLAKEAGPPRAEFSLMLVQASVVVALAMLAVTLGLGFGALMEANVGFRRTDSVVVEFTSGGPVNAGTRVSEFEALQTELSSRGIDAAIINASPLSDREQLTSVSHPLTGSTVMIGLKVMTSNYLDVSGLELLSGRPLSDASPGQLLLNDAAARFLFGASDAAGRSLRHGASAWTVSGVVKSVRHRSLFDDARPEAYVLYRDVASFSPKAAEFATGRFFVIAADSAGGPQTIDLVRTISGSVLPDARFASASHFKDLLRQAAGERPALVEAVSGVSAAAILVMIAGLYGMFAQAVTRRSREIAIRMSLGATPRRIAIERLRPALSIWAAATLLGVLMFAWGDRLLAFSLAAPAGLPQPPFTLVALLASGILLLTIAAAAMGPVRRAARLQPGPLLKAD